MEIHFAARLLLDVAMSPVRQTDRQRIWFFFSFFNLKSMDFNEINENDIERGSGN